MEHIKLFNESWFNRKKKPILDPKREEEEKQRIEKNKKYQEEQNADKPFVQNLFNRMKASESDIKNVEYNKQENWMPNRISTIHSSISCDFDGDKITILIDSEGYNDEFEIRINGKKIKCYDEATEYRGKNKGPISGIFNILIQIYKKGDDESTNTTLTNFRNKYK